MDNIEIWCGVNRNGKLSIHLDEPVRDEKHGIWISSRPYANSFIHEQTDDIINMANITWKDEPEFFSIMINNQPLLESK